MVSIMMISRMAAGVAVLATGGAILLQSGVSQAAGEAGGTPMVQASVMAGSLGQLVPAPGLTEPGPAVTLPRQAVVTTAVQATPGAPLSPGVDPQPVSALGLPCGLNVDSMAMPGAMIALDIMAPCQPDARVVIEHSGLTLIGRTDAYGLLTMDIPALETPAFLNVELPDGSVETTLVALPDLADVSRVALQWEAPGALELHAMEFGASFGGPGHIWQEAPGDIATALQGTGGFLVTLGTEATDGPMAQVYTLPHASLRPGDSVAVSIDAAITTENCGQAISAHAMQVLGGNAGEIMPIDLTMPGCDAVGDYLVLQNLVLGPTFETN